MEFEELMKVAEEEYAQQQAGDEESKVAAEESKEGYSELSSPRNSTIKNVNLSMMRTSN